MHASMYYYWDIFCSLRFRCCILLLYKDCFLLDLSIHLFLAALEIGFGYFLYIYEAVRLVNRFCMFDVMPWMGLEVTSFFIYD